MTTTKNRPADALRAALKTEGFHSRRVTVREHHSTLYVTIRDESASLTQVTSIAEAFESVSRDHATGEILCGGNMYVQVGYTDAIVNSVKATILAVLDPARNDEYVDLPGGYRAIKCTREHGGATYVGEVRIYGPGFDFRNHIAAGVEYAAKRIAVAYIDTTAQAQGAAPTVASNLLPGLDQRR